MLDSVSPFQQKPPSTRRLATSVVVAVFGAGLVLVTIVLPAEHGIDPTGVGRALGLTALTEPTRTVRIADVVGGNERYREVQVPAFGEPTPLPNPAVFQSQPEPPRVEVRTITLQAGQETEIKAVLRKGQMVQFSWTLDRGQVYVDFHGHEPEAGETFWVRYEEQQAGSRGSGSLVAPFSGEHGWFWKNYNPFPVVVTLNLSGYYDRVVDYGQR